MVHNFEPAIEAYAKRAVERAVDVHAREARSSSRDVAFSTTWVRPVTSINAPMAATPAATPPLLNGRVELLERELEALRRAREDATVQVEAQGRRLWEGARQICAAVNIAVPPAFRFA
jgi:hypothetical protein